MEKMHKILDGGSLRLRGVYDNSFYGRMHTFMRRLLCKEFFVLSFVVFVFTSADISENEEHFFGKQDGRAP